MSQLILRPTGAGHYTELTPSTGSNWECVNEASVSDTDYVSMVTEAAIKYDTYALTNHTTESGTINSVTVYFRVGVTGASARQTKPRIRLGTTDVTGSIASAPAGSWTTFSETLARPGGGSWTWTDIDNLEAGVGLNANSTADIVKCSWLYVVVDHTESSGNQIFFMF